MFSPLKFMICLLSFCLVSPPLLQFVRFHLRLSDMICSEGLGLEKGSDAYQSCLRKEQDRDVAKPV